MYSQVLSYEAYLNPVSMDYLLSYEYSMMHVVIEETFLQYISEILKRSIKNFLRRCHRYHVKG